MTFRENESGLPSRSNRVPVPERMDEDARPYSRPYGGGASSSGFDWERYLSAVHRYKWTILLVTLLGTGAGLALAHWMGPTYMAQTTLWIDWRDRASSVQSNNLRPIQADELLESYNWVDLLQSFAVLEHAVREQRLYLVPESDADTTALASFRVEEGFVPGEYRLSLDRDGEAWTLTSGDSTEVESGRVGDSIGLGIGFQWQPSREALLASDPVEFELLHPRDAARGLREELNTFMLERGNFLRIELEGSNPEKTKAILSSVTERFTELATELKRRKIDELGRLLDDQLASARSNLDQAETDLESFRVRNAGQPTRGVFSSSSSGVSGLRRGDDETTGPSLDARYQTVQFEIQDIQREQEMIAAALEGDQGAGERIDMLATIPAVQNSPTLSTTLEELTQKQAEVRALLQLYTEQHEEVRRVQGEIQELRNGTIPQLARNLLGQLAARENQLSNELGSMSETLRDIPARTTEEAELERRARIAEDLYATLQSRHEEARLAAASTLPDVEILDPAEVGRQPISDDGPRVIAMAFAGSLGLALLGAILMDRMDTRVRYPEEVSRGMGLRILGTIPHLKAKHGVLDVQEAGAATEAFRTLRLNLSHAHGSAGPVVTTVTSPSPGDGKSFVALNLALTYARLGRKTLLIDGDVRKGRLYRLLERQRKPGLTDHLSNGKGAAEVIQGTSYENLDFIATGRGMQAGPELLQSPRMQELMMQIRRDYEAIIVDSPPLGAGVDPLVLSTFTGNLLLVLRAGTTKRALTEAKIDLMTPLPIRILGAVLNDVGRSESYYKYYGSYIPGYEVRNQGVQEVSGRLLETSARS